MAVFDMKPYFYRVTFPATTSFDANGDPVKASGSTDTVSSLYPCDKVQDGKAGEITLEDGTKIAYTHTIYADNETPNLRTAQKIEVLDKSSNVIFTGTIKGFCKFQTHTKIWV